MRTGLIALAVLTLIPAWMALAAQGPAAPSAAASRPANNTLPPDVMRTIDGLFANRPKSTQEAVQMMRFIIELGADAERQYPRATDLYRAQMAEIQAASRLIALNGGPEVQKVLVDVATRMLNSPTTPPKQKLQADFFVTLSQVQSSAQAAKSPGTAPAPGDNAQVEIKAFVARYEDGPFKGQAILLAASLAAQTEQKALAQEYADVLQANYLQEEGVRKVLRQMGRHPDIGQPFQAELTTLDGTKLTLPDDMRGKVVAICFWMMTSNHSLAELPYLKQLHETYGPKGVEIINVSLDQSDGKEKLQRFAIQQGMNWTQAYTGMYWNDPTAQKYGIDAIPSFWVVGKDGKVIYDGPVDATPDEVHKAVEKALDEALAGGATPKPARPRTRAGK